MSENFAEIYLKFREVLNNYIKPGQTVYLIQLLNKVVLYRLVGGMHIPAFPFGSAIALDLEPNKNEFYINICMAGCRR